LLLQKCLRDKPRLPPRNCPSGNTLERREKMKITWTDELKDWLVASSDDELQEFVNEKGLKYESVSRFRRKLRGKNPKAKKSLVEFLTSGKRDFEIEEYFGKPVSEVLSEAPDGYELFKTRDEHLNQVYVLIPEVPMSYELKPKIWTYRWQPDGQPYLWIKFPDDFDRKKIKIVPIADLHAGNQACNMAKFREWVNWIASREDVFAFINGDLFENAHGDSNKGISIYEQTTRPRGQLDELLNILAPIAHKILWAIPGNHEDRSRTRDFDPLEWLCDKLQVPYSYFPVFVDVLWKGFVFDFFCQHGNTGSGTKGGKMNAAGRPLKWNEQTCFTVMAHVHDATTNTTVCIVRDRKNFELIEKKQYVLICPAFLNYFGSYAAKANLEPGAQGTINCELFANGDYHLSS